jgi:hypothetical protein
MKSLRDCLTEAIQTRSKGSVRYRFASDPELPRVFSVIRHDRCYHTLFDTPDSALSSRALVLKCVSRGECEEEETMSWVLRRYVPSSVVEFEQQMENVCGELGKIFDTTVTDVLLDLPLIPAPHFWLNAPT